MIKSKIRSFTSKQTLLKTLKYFNDITNRSVLVFFQKPMITEMSSKTMNNNMTKQLRGTIKPVFQTNKQKYKSKKQFSNMIKALCHSNKCKNYTNSLISRRKKSTTLYTLIKSRQKFTTHIQLQQNVIINSLLIKFKTLMKKESKKSKIFLKSFLTLCLKWVVSLAIKVKKSPTLPQVKLTLTLISESSWTTTSQKETSFSQKCSSVSNNHKL